MSGCPFGFDLKPAMEAVESLTSALSPNNTAQYIPIKQLSPEEAAQYRNELIACRDALRAFINEKNCHPIFVRYAWHDSGTFDVRKGGDQFWPAAGGANGSIRFKEELDHGANAGLSKAKTFLQKFKDEFSILSWADIIQMASAEAIALAGGPKINMRYGREDAESCPSEGNLPDALPPFKGEKTAAEHLRNVFYRMGFNDQDIVALSGAHTIGRAFKERSGVTENGYGKKGTPFTSDKSNIARCDGKEGLGMLGGKSWTQNWLTFDNSYYHYQDGEGDKKLWLPTDDALRNDPGFKGFYEIYAESKETFFRDYAEAHRRLSELGSRFVVPGGIYLKDSKM